MNASPTRESVANFLLYDPKAGFDIILFLAYKLKRQTSDLTEKNKISELIDLLNVKDRTRYCIWLIENFKYSATMYNTIHQKEIIKIQDVEDEIKMEYYDLSNECHDLINQHLRGVISDEAVLPAYITYAQIQIQIKRIELAKNILTDVITTFGDKDNLHIKLARVILKQIS